MQHCDHKSVGILVERDGKILLLERRQFPPGFAIPAGHVDDHGSFDDAAIAELREETGLRVMEMECVGEGRKKNPCRREGGTWHHWRIYRAVAEGDVVRSPTETKQAGWYARGDIETLAARTKAYLEGAIPEAEWQERPGLEPVCRDWLVDLGII